jgi:biopolymer transport protein ExbB
MKLTFTSLISGLLLFSAATLATAQATAPATEQEGQAGTRSDLRVNEAASLDQLLQNVRQRTVVESRLHAEREARFRRDKDQQQQMLSQARSERTREERRSEQLETRFEENEIRLGQLQEQLTNRLGALRELFGVLQQVSGDTRGLFEGSIISAQYPNRGEWLDALARRMGTASSLASIDEMETLWFELQREMTESGKVVKFPATVIMNNGQQVETEVTRVGAFNLIANGRYIQYDPADDTLVELARQPAGRFTATASRLAAAGPDDIIAFAVDPTRGSLLSLLIQAATVGERVGSPFGGIATGECYLPFCDGEGGYVGSVIIMGGIFGVILALWKLIQLSIMGRAVAAQKNSETADEGNPLGRVLKVYHDNRDVDVETLELKLGEAILGETPKITSNITLMQVISVVAPLLGLLGTVIGMILTFQAITLFGTGDPKTMAGGISTALMTTVLGLCVAIPMTLLHSIVASRSRAVIHVLEEQSAGIVAEHAERTGQALG